MQFRNTDLLKTTMNDRGFLKRMKGDLTCQLPQCAWEGNPRDLLSHLETQHAYPDYRIDCQWGGACDFMVFRSFDPVQKLCKHILNEHLLFSVRHCPYCHQEVHKSRASRLHEHTSQCPRAPEVILEILNTDDADISELSWSRCVWCTSEVVPDRLLFG